MAIITPTTGLISGLQTQEIINALVSSQNNVLLRLQTRADTFKATQLGLQTLSAKLLTLSTSAASLGTESNFSKFKAASSNPDQLTAVASDTAVPGDYQFQVLRLTSSQQVLSRGYSDTTTQTVGAGTITIASGGRLATDTALDALNGGNGVRRGVIRITDRTGTSADVDLTAASSLTDVLDAINNSGLSVAAEAEGDKLVLQDTSGQSVSNLIVADKSGGNAALDLGIRQSVAGTALTGSSIYSLSGSFALSKLNDGNGVRVATGQSDLQITLTDVADTTLDVDLDGATTLADVVTRINSHADNAGKLTASIADGRLVLTDNTGGGGSNPLAVTSLNGSNAAEVLGLGATAVGNTLSGERLTAGLNSVLLRNLRGGLGIDNVGQISLTDRTGKTATLDLTGAESLDEVLRAINTAEDGLGNPLAITAEFNAAGNGLVLRDTSGASASNLIIADVGGSTLATQLGIAIDAAQTEVSSGSLKLRYVNEATSLSKYGPNGADVRRGAIGITDSTGVEHFINISTSLKTIGDVIQEVNTASGGKVTAELNETGDGFVLIDQAGGTQQLVVRDVGGQAGADLRLVGTGALGTDGKSRVSGRQATTIIVTETDNLQTLADKLNAAKAGFNAAIIDDGTSFSPKRLVLTAKTSGGGGRQVIDDGGLGLQLTERVRGQDALLRLGADAASGFVVSSSTNVFDNVVSGLTLTAKAVGTSPVTISVSRDADKLADILKSFVKGYNDTIQQVTDSTVFNTTTNQRGALQGEGITLRVTSALSSLANGLGFGAVGSSVRKLRDMGVTLQADGKLSFDTEAFAEIAAEDPDAVADFFLNETTGFAAKLKATVESFTDSEDGKLAAAEESAKASVDNLEKRMAAVQLSVDARKERLLAQFVRMEQILSSLNSQQSALEKIQSLQPAK